MAFQRAQWHSGLTYKQTCTECKQVLIYQDTALDFRPWYADGFVYCPRCHTPLRHNENFAIDQSGNYINVTPVDIPAPFQYAPAPVFNGKAAFCTNCGKKFNAGDNFCSGCGAKRD